MIKAIETRYKGYRFRSNDLPIEPKIKLSKRADRMNEKFGRLIVKDFLGMAKGGFRWWGCECDCGELVAVRSRELDRGHTRSCGCLQREKQLKNGGKNKLPQGYASRNELLASYKKSAEKRNIEWGLNNEKFFLLVKKNCSYCGCKPNRERKANKGVNGGFFYTGVDRIENSKGYVEGNVASCCWDCNRAKGVMELNDFKKWINRIISFNS